MRKVIYYMMVTLNGLSSGPNGELDLFGPDDEMMQFALPVFSAADAILFGRVTYELLASYWTPLASAPHSTTPKGDIEFAKLFKNMKRIVFSRTLKHVDDKAVLIRENIGADVAKLKQQSGGHLLLICRRMSSGASLNKNLPFARTGAVLLHCQTA
jgi:dihydrofolate reductase